jgi:hypothetical protein
LLGATAGAAEDELTMIAAKAVSAASIVTTAATALRSRIL